VGTPVGRTRPLPSHPPQRRGGKTSHRSWARTEAERLPPPATEPLRPAVSTDAFLRDAPSRESKRVSMLTSREPRSSSDSGTRGSALFRAPAESPRRGRCRKTNALEGCDGRRALAVTRWALFESLTETMQGSHTNGASHESRRGDAVPPARESAAGYSVRGEASGFDSAEFHPSF
jgi:hypothetical protein